MSAAGLRQTWVTFQREHKTADAQGGSVVAWASFYECWARWLPGAGDERFIQGALSEQATSRIFPLWCPELKELTTADRAVIEDKLYQIRGIADPMQRRYEIEIVIEFGVAT